jgi:hypothetical protein
MLAAYDCGSKLLILSQNTVRVSAPVPFSKTRVSVPCRFSKARVSVPCRFLDARVLHPSRFSKGGTMAGAMLSAPVGLWKLGFTVGFTWKSGPSGPRKGSSMTGLQPQPTPTSRLIVRTFPYPQNVPRGTFLHFVRQSDGDDLSRNATLIPIP